MPTGTGASSDEALAVTARASGLFQTAPAISTLTASASRSRPFPDRQPVGVRLSVHAAS